MWIFGFPGEAFIYYLSALFNKLSESDGFITFSASYLKDEGNLLLYYI